MNKSILPSLAIGLGLVIFSVNSASAQTELITNGDFETGGFGGWTPIAAPGSGGTIAIDIPGTTTPAISVPTAPNPNGGAFYAVTHQGGPGTYVLLQSFTVPMAAGSLTFSFDFFANTGEAVTINPAGLTHTAGPNQHARIDLLTGAAAPFDTGAGVIANFYLGKDPGPIPNPYTSYVFDFGGLVTAGMTYQIRFAQVDNLGVFNMGVDNVSILWVAAPLATGGSSAPVPVLVTNGGAILSANTSGLGMGLVNQQITQNAPNAALRDLNNRLFRARSGLGEPAALTSTFGSDSSLLRYLAFVQDENMSYKVALGLADGEERMVEVNMVDTLSAQAGTLLNGQTMGGGLPYAMMGVPLMPMAGGAATVQIVEASSSGKAVIDDAKAVVESEPWNRWELFAAGDFSFYDQDQLTDLMQGFDTDTYAGTVGLEYRLKRWLNVGLAWSYLQSDTNVSGNYGDIDLEGNLISTYATAFWRQYWADILYSYGSFNNDLRRNTGLGSTVRGDTESQSHNFRLNFGRNFNVGNNITTGPVAGLRYSNGDIDGYSERGASSAALNYNGTDFESMVSRLGWQATHVKSTTWGRLVSQMHLAWEHEYMPENGTVGVALQTSPFALVTGGSVNRFGGYSTESDGAHPGTDWLSAGLGLRFELANGVALATDYEGVFFRSNASQHYASAKVSYEWGAFMPHEKVEGDSGKEVVAYEPLPVEQPEQQVAQVAPAKAEKKKSGDFLSWLQKKNRNSGTEEAVSKPQATKQTASIAGTEAKPAAVYAGGRSSQKGAVVYKTWKDVPGLKKSKAAPAKAAEANDPSS